MAKRKLKVLINIGLDHAEEYGIPAALEDEVVSVTEDQANVMVNVLKVAKDYSESDEREEAERTRRFDEQNIDRGMAAGLIQDESRFNRPRATRERPKPTRNVPAEETSSEEEAQSPVIAMTADESIDHISRMRSTEKLQEIVDTDGRSTVVDAAKRRLSEIG